MKSSKTILCLGIATALTLSAHAIANDADVQDMSDPLAVYTQAGLGYTDKGLNLKIGQTYDTGSDTTMGMNVVEVKGFAGDAVAGMAVVLTTVSILSATAILMLI